MDQALPFTVFPMFSQGINEKEEIKAPLQLLENLNTYLQAVIGDPGGAQVLSFLISSAYTANRCYRN